MADAVEKKEDLVGNILIAIEDVWRKYIGNTVQWGGNMSETLTHLVIRCRSHAS